MEVTAGIMIVTNTPRANGVTIVTHNRNVATLSQSSHAAHDLQGGVIWGKCTVERSMRQHLKKKSKIVNCDKLRSPLTLMQVKSGSVKMGASENCSNKYLHWCTCIGALHQP